MAAAPPFDEVWFDCDSTLSTLEGIDELAALRPGRRAEIAEATRRAMAGEIPLEEVYARRLDLAAPGASDLERLGRRYAETLTPDAAEVAAALRLLGKRVAIVSGGLLPAVLGCARAVGVPPEDVRAVAVHADAAGAYAGFDRSSPLARSGGKSEVLRAAAKPGVRRVLVGDGATDAEAAPAVDLFVGYGGVVAREAVRRIAPVFLTAPSMAPLLGVVLTDAERGRLRADARFRDLLARADAGASSVVRA